jgi:hypothetical protein
MPDKFAESTARLQGLIAEVMKEQDPTRYDQLCQEIWLVLADRELLEFPRRAAQNAITQAFRSVGTQSPMLPRPR